ncbi:MULTISPECIES: AraC family transcriptional regulator [Pedobacter]|uniref:Helix-turn-helix-domain containing protein AraC type n=1 Tax=Pedobacter heparinus (strain ATCC 13125 / DSM 2366 / CIP 104194 / JCM 7457 / NBRC 12017 / NCIMB 9290 / NRRL B-14731 / HIM 762-3) TaxID=485917 RepID=C6Y390_PEDHD|nr:MULTISPECIES: AraC family transcriptional regulator [Pedobacter]ACU05315.1 helix-turn-helix- domain containing protein AraC type [Pedobacter heparinus DSM 2366]MBB5439550.1 AraC-like DNA-binding protein [Pedobacter sp. AK017]
MSDFDTRSTTERSIITFNKFNLDGKVRLGRYSYKHVHGELETHSHDGMMEICYCDKGMQVYEVNGKEYQIRGGDVFITFPNEPHGTAKHPEEKGTLYWLIVQIPEKEKFLHYDNEESAVFIKELLGIKERHFKGSDAMKKMLDQLFALHEEPVQQPLYKLHTLNLISNFLLTVIEYSQKNPVRAQSDRISEIKNYIHNNIYESLPIELLAKALFMSDSHFKSWFKKEFGMPPVDYILRTKIEEAKKLLLLKDSESVTAIAFKLNFSSSQYFATVFKKYTGVSPAEFKQRNLKT